MRRYVQTSEGIHLVLRVTDDRTLCGDVLEGDKELGIEEAIPSNKGVVTCPRCTDIIRLCRGVRIRLPDTA